jgi:PAS domain S-box-containing protein
MKVKFRNKPLRDDNGKAIRSAAPDSDELLRLIVESATDFAIISIDPGRNVTSWNKGAERVLGFDAEDVIGHTADVIFTPEDRQAGAPEAECALAIQHGRAEDERWTLRADGSRFWASGLMLPLADRSLGFVKILRDRTEMHVAQMQLRQNEERFRILATSIPDLVFRSLPDGTRSWGSPQWIEYTGLVLEDSVGLGWLDAVHPDDREATLSAWAHAPTQGQYYVEHRVRRRKDGAWRWHQTRARPIVAQPGATGALVGSGTEEWVGVMTDVHDLRQMKDQQEVLLAELQHRTRNLLAVVQSIALQTLRKSDTLKAFESEFTGRLRALSRVQALWARRDDREIDLRDLLVTELAAHGDDVATSERVALEGPSILLQPEPALILGLGLHELATNAVKYGALAQASGKLFITWRLTDHNGRAAVALNWAERGVTIKEATTGRARKGYGSELIERALPYQLGAETKLEFAPDGVRCALIVPLDHRRT